MLTINTVVSIYIIAILMFSYLSYRLKANGGYQNLNVLHLLKNIKDDYQTFIAKVKLFSQYTLSFLTTSTMIFSSALIISLGTYSVNPTDLRLYLTIILAISVVVHQFFLARLLVKANYLKKLVYIRTHE